MTRHQLVSNPFALMMNPQDVIRAVEASERLASLTSHVCRPLDKPLIPKVGDETADYDRSLDAVDPDAAAEH